MISFSLVAFKIDYNVPPCGSLCVQLTQSSFNSLDIYIYDFHQICYVFRQYFFKQSICPSLFSSSWTPIVYKLIHLMVTHRFHRLCFLFFCFFSVLKLSNFHCSIFKFTNSSAWSNLTLKSFRKYYNSIILLFRYRIFFRIQISIFIFSIYSYIVCFLSFIHIFFQIFQLFKTVVLIKSLSSISAIKSFRDRLC